MARIPHMPSYITEAVTGKTSYTWRKLAMAIPSQEPYCSRIRKTVYIARDISGVSHDSGAEIIYEIVIRQFRITVQGSVVNKELEHKN
jgi:hypothetical protein